MSLSQSEKAGLPVNGSPIPAAVSLTELVRSALGKALSENSTFIAIENITSPASPDPEVLAEFVAADTTFLKELRFIVMLAFEREPDSLCEAMVQLGDERMHNAVFTCLLLDRLRRQKDVQWCLHRALFLADVCWAVSRLNHASEPEQIYIVRLLHGLGCMPAGWAKLVHGGEQLHELMQLAELAVYNMPPVAAQSTPFASMEASHEWLATKNLEGFLDSLAIVQ